MMTDIKIGGVPEHFNLPIHLAIESGAFEEVGINLEWITFDGGTGQMTKALRSDESDICILLTEGIISDIYKGNPSKIVSVYVQSPLTWGIHTGYTNPLRHYEDIFDKRIAISRFGSGSHLMSIVDANMKEQKTSDDQYVVINNLSGALQSLQNLESDVFYWEKFTTKPFVDNGLLRRIGEFVTPWPCFVVAARDQVLQEKRDAVIQLLKVIHKYCSAFMKDSQSIKMVSARYGLQLEDAAKWFHSTEWAEHGWVNNKMIENVTYYLQMANIIEHDDQVPILWDRNLM